MKSNCAFAEEVYDFVPLHALQWLYVLLCIASLILVLYTARYYLNRTIFENVTKELIIVLYIFIALYSFCFMLAQLMQLVYRYTAKDKCDAQVPKEWCLLRYINSAIVCAFIVVHIGITVQHALSTIKFEFRTQKIIVRLFIALSFLYPIVLGLCAYWNESLEGYTTYCVGITPSSSSVLAIDLCLLLALDIGNALTSLLLWKYNHTRMANEQTFNLTLSFHRRQNIYAMQQFLPIATIHTLLYIVFTVSIYFSQLYKSSMSPIWYLFATVVANVIPFYCFLSPLIFLILVRRGRFKRVSHVQNLINTEQNSNQLYFAALRDQWK